MYILHLTTPSHFPQFDFVIILGNFVIIQSDCFKFELITALKFGVKFSVSSGLPYVFQ